MLYKDKQVVYLANYIGSISNTFKIAYNTTQALEEDKLETYSKLPGLGPLKLFFNGLRTFYGLNTDGSWTIKDIHSDHSTEIKGFFVDFYITGGSVNIEATRCQIANPPRWNERNQVEEINL